MNKIILLFLTVFCTVSLFSQAPTISDIKFEGLKKTKEKIQSNFAHAGFIIN